jgi:hypothetical protein
MIKMASYNEELLRLMPKVLRARDFHLYTEGGKGSLIFGSREVRRFLATSRPAFCWNLKTPRRGDFSALSPIHWNGVL